MKIFLKSCKNFFKKLGTYWDIRMNEVQIQFLQNKNFCKSFYKTFRKIIREY